MWAPKCAFVCRMACMDWDVPRGMIAGLGSWWLGTIKERGTTDSSAAIFIVLMSKS